MEKYYTKKGRVGVLVSYGYGAGWSTWRCKEDSIEFFCMDKTLVEMKLNDVPHYEVEEYIQSLNYDYYMGGWDDTVVVFLEPNTKFVITEYDGYESLKTYDDFKWLTS